jgi:hypothetical protein
VGHALNGGHVFVGWEVLGAHFDRGLLILKTNVQQEMRFEHIEEGKHLEIFFINIERQPRIHLLRG